MKEAFAAYRKAREAIAQVRANQPELASEVRNAAARFNQISEELAQLHCQKYGEWHITWRGPIP